MRHAILGVGGVGGLIAACLAKSGASVTLVVRPEVERDYPAQIQLESCFGNFSVNVGHATTVPQVDVVWITVKATQLESALALFPNDKRAGTIVPLLNGIDHVALLRSRYGIDSVIPATIGVESERVGVGHIVHRSPFARLSVASSGRSRLQESVKQLQGMGFSCEFVDDEATLLWSKLIFLAPLALTSTATSKTTGEMRSDPAIWQDLQACVREASAVAQAEGAKIETDKAIEFIASLPGNMRSSMQKDVAQGKTPELDAIAGPILRGGIRHQLAVPVTQKLASLVRSMLRP